MSKPNERKREKEISSLFHLISLILFGISLAGIASGYVNIDIQDNYQEGYQFIEDNETITLLAPLNVTLIIPKELINVVFLENDSIGLLLTER